MVRALLGILSTEKNPKLTKEYEILSQLLTEHGSPCSLEKTCAMLLLFPRQTYYHYIFRLKECKHKNELATVMKKLKKFHELMLARNAARSQSKEEDEALMNRLEKRLIREMNGFFKNYQNSKNNAYLKTFCDNYSYENACRIPANKFLQKLDSKLPLTVLEYFNIVWNQRNSLL